MTATDPRLAPLADVLRADFGPSWFPGLTDVTIIAKTPEEAAAAILADLDALPGMLWDDLSYQAGLEDGRTEQAAAIATLRADKVLALKQVRAVINTLPTTMGHGTINRIGVLDIVDDAIRAALAAAGEATE
jgi:hypothetical protein